MCWDGFGICGIFWFVRKQILILVAISLALCSCGKSIEKQTRDQVRKLCNADLDEKQVTVFNVKKVGDLATAEVEITTAVKMHKEDDKWLIQEVRIGNRNWEEVDRLEKAVNQLRIEDTMAIMKKVMEAAQKYRSERNEFGYNLDYPALIDLIYPTYISIPAREDAWNNPFTFLVTAEALQIRSAGPDGRVGSKDDLVLNDEK